MPALVNWPATTGAKSHARFGAAVLMFPDAGVAAEAPPPPRRRAARHSAVREKRDLEAPASELFIVDCSKGMRRAEASHGSGALQREGPLGRGASLRGAPAGRRSVFGLSLPLDAERLAAHLPLSRASPRRPARRRPRAHPRG